MAFPGGRTDLQRPARRLWRKRRSPSHSWKYNQGFSPKKLCSAVFIRNEKTADPYLFLRYHKLNNQLLLMTLIIQLLFLNAGLSACSTRVVLIKPNCRYVTSKYTPHTSD